MMTTLNKVFAVRGLLAFLAFIELVNSFRSLLPSLFTLPHERVSESFIQNKIFNLLDLSSDTQDLVGTLFGFYSLLNAIVLSHSALQLHHHHMVSLAVLTLSTKTVFLLSSHRHTSSLTIPLLLTTATLAGLLLLLLSNYIHHTPGSSASENEMLLRAMKKSVKNKRKSD